MSVEIANPKDSLQVSALMASSQPRRQTGVVPLLLMVVLIAALVTVKFDSPWLEMLMPLVLIGVVVLTVLHSRHLIFRHRHEQQLLRETDELIRLSRWDEAVSHLEQMLGYPMQRAHSRFQALIYLGSVLIRQESFEQAVMLYDYLLEEAGLPLPIAFSVRCARLYVLLREDRLLDAHQMIVRLRRESPTPSAMLGLLEMYRDVKTGHPEEALAIFDQQRAAFPAQLGHRSSDAWALAAAASAHLQKSEQASVYASRAAILCSRQDIVRRFPECATVLQSLPKAPEEIMPEQEGGR